MCITSLSVLSKWQKTSKHLPEATVVSCCRDYSQQNVGGPWERALKTVLAVQSWNCALPPVYVARGCVVVVDSLAQLRFNKRLNWNLLFCVWNNEETKAQVVGKESSTPIWGPFLLLWQLIILKCIYFWSLILVLYSNNVKRKWACLCSASWLSLASTSCLPVVTESSPVVR